MANTKTSAGPSKFNYFKAVKKNFKPKNYVNYLLVILCFAVFMVLDSAGVLKRSTYSLMTQIGYSIILAVSLNIVVGFLGELSLGHAGFMCVGAYLGAFCAGYLREVISNKFLVLLITMLIGGLAAALLGFIVGIPALRLKGDYLAIVTLAFGEIVRNLFKNLPWFGGAMGFNTPTYDATPLDSNNPAGGKGMRLFLISLIVVFVMLILVQNLIKSKHGRAITAIRDNEIAARAMGINVTYYKLFAFVISAFFAGIAGVIYGNYSTPILYSAFDFNKSIEILVMVVLGGMGNITGSILSAVLLTSVNFLLGNYLTGNLAALKLLVYALILMIVVIFTNAPALRPIKEKLSFNRLKNKIREKKVSKNPEKAAADIRNDPANWAVIPTKISMDEILTTDVVNKENEAASDNPDGSDMGGAR